MLLSGYPQATLPGLCDRLTSLRNRPRKQSTATRSPVGRCALFGGCLVFRFPRYELIELDGYNGLMRKSGC